MNTVKAGGLSLSELCPRLAVLAIMKSESRDAAIATMEQVGVASACPTLAADFRGGSGLECNSNDVVKLEINSGGTSTHTYH